MSQPSWLEQAWAELGRREVPGTSDNPHILSYFRELGFSEVQHDEVAWCAAFVGACLERSGVRSTRLLLARSYEEFGDELDEPRLGSIVVLSRGGDPSLGHVGFYLGESSTRIFLLGGNQGDAVSVEGFDKSRVLSTRWPSHTPLAGTDPPGGTSTSSAPDIFETALAHVLKMEGGWTDDPYDPGGATNYGITLGDYARWRNVSIAEGTPDGLKAELRSISEANVREIYRSFYWQPSSAGMLQPALAVMHFDASVNHGLDGAARMLQLVLGVSVDGEIGPKTLAAAKTCDVRSTVSAYADMRRATYRSLSTFWRFGRGWLARVDATEKFARSQPDRAQNSLAKGDKDMPVASAPTGNGKWWGQSVTIWGAIVTTFSTVLPVLAPLLGLHLSAETVQQLGAETLTLFQALGGLLGTLMTIYGRARADQPLLRRDVTVKI